MKIICPEHRGLIHVGISIFGEKNIRIKKIVECPVCDEEVLINGRFNFDAEGLAMPVSEHRTPN